jgi:hypothetical protein
VPEARGGQHLRIRGRRRVPSPPYGISDLTTARGHVCVGSNGHRPRLWKAALQDQIFDRDGVHVTVCHCPTGASKWSPVEHRLFGPLSVNWAGQPRPSEDCPTSLSLA